MGSTTGISFTANAAGSRGNADGDSTTWTNTHAVAGNTLTVRSGGDTNLVGAVASGNQVVADVGGNLNIERLQDTSTYQSKNQSAGVSVSVCVPPLCVGQSSGSVSISQEKIDSNYASVNEQSGIHAGDGGFQVNVAGNTDLKGGVITSTDAAVQDGSNSFSTGALTMSDIENHADYKGTGVSANIGPVVSLDGGLTAGTSSAGFAQRDGSASSVISSGISGIAGDTTVRTGDQQTGITPIFDLAKIQSEVDAQVKITQQFSEQASTALTNYVTGQRSDLHQIIEAYAGTHDFIGGQLSGLYDSQGNTKQEMSSTEKNLYDAGSAVAIVPATPFAAATVLPPQVWNAIATILQILK